MADDELSKEDGSRLAPRLKDFTDRVIVPALVREYLAQSRELAEDQPKVSDPGNLSAVSSGAQGERQPRVSDEKQMRYLIGSVEAGTQFSVSSSRLWASRSWHRHNSMPGTSAVPSCSSTVHQER